MTTIFNWFKEAVPTPTPRNFDVQLGCHLEEVHEMLETMNCDDSKWKELIANILHVSYNLKKGHSTAICFNQVELLDAMCDQVVTATGVAYMAGHEFDGALAEVNRSNWSKFENGKAVFDENGKIKKGASFTRPSLGEFVSTLARD